MIPQPVRWPALHDRAMHVTDDNERPWRVEGCYGSLGLISPAGKLVSTYQASERRRADEDADRLNGKPRLRRVRIRPKREA